MAAEENDILARFIRNEKTAKTWTLVSVIIFVALAFGILYLMSELKKAKDATEAAKEATDRALSRADSINSVLETFKTSQENTAKLANSAPIEIAKNEGIFVPQRPIKPPEKSINSSGRKKDVIVFVQYKKEYYDQCQLLVRTLKADKYLVPGKELIEKINFSSSVKYFNDSDKMWADSVAAVVNTTLGRNESNLVPAVRDYLKAPKGQLEVWMGDYRAPATAELVKKYNSPRTLKLKN